MEFSPLPLEVLALGRSDYQEVLEIQNQVHREVVAGNAPQTIILCEHNPIITFGKSALGTSLLTPSPILEAEGINLLQVGRGGDYTYHGPGQLIAYPILDLKTRRRDVAWYMRTLEECIIRLLKEYGTSGTRIAGRTGVFVSPTAKQRPSSRPRKICSIGVRISRWCTLHGLALYISPQSDGFRHINPCGYSDIDVTSLSELGCLIDWYQIETRFLEVFCSQFGYSQSGFRWEGHRLAGQERELFEGE